MRAFVTGLAVLAAVLGFVAVGHAAPKPKAASVTLKASAGTITASQPVTLSGQVKGAKGVLVTLMRRATPDTAFTPAGTATTDGTGKYSFTARPLLNTVYRVVAATTPASQSPDVTTLVRPLVGLKVSDATPHKGQRVRFHGTVRPPRDGSRVSLQRRRSDGTWATVVRPTLQDAGTVYSSYSRKLRIKRSGSYRTVIAADAQHARGVSRVRTLTVG